MRSRGRTVCFNRFISVAALVVPLVVFGCTGLGEPATDDTGRFDATYDYNVQFPVPGGGTSSASCQDCVFIDNGSITNIEGSFSGGVTDANFGNIAFGGPCPVGGTANYDGILNDGNPKNGQGQYVCIENGVTGQWSIFNGG